MIWVGSFNSLRTALRKPRFTNASREVHTWLGSVDKLILPRYTQPSPDTKLLIEKLRLELPNQPPSRLVAQKESNEIEVQTSR